MKKKLVGFGAVILSLSLMSTSVFAEHGEGKRDYYNGFNQGYLNVNNYVNPYINVNASFNPYQDVNVDQFNPFNQDGNINNQMIAQLIQNKQQIASLKSHLVHGKKRAQLQQLMSSLANAYAQNGSYEDAIQSQQDGLLSNYQFGDLTPYQQLGQYYQQAGDTGIKAYVNGKIVQTAIQPFTFEGHTLIPLRAISEELQATVTWDPAAQSITVTRGANSIVFIVGSRSVTVNGQKEVLDVPAMIRGGQTFIPLRAMGELLGAHVTYIPEGNIAIIEDKSVAQPDDLNSLFPVTGTTATTTTTTTPSTTTSTTSSVEVVPSNTTTTTVGTATYGTSTSTTNGTTIPVTGTTTTTTSH